jgi:hypothetical protein
MSTDAFTEHRDEAGELRVAFGPGHSQTMPIDWAERMLSEWREKQPAVFGKYLSEAAMNAK